MRTDLRRLRPDAPAHLRRLLLDAAPTVGILALGFVDLFVASGTDFEGPKAANTAFLVAACLPLLARRKHPVAALAAAFTVQAAWIDAYYNGSQQPPFEPFVAGIVACFALGFHSRRRQLRLGVTAFAATVAVGTAVAYATGDPSLGNGLPAVIWWLAAIAIGRGLRERQSLVDLLRERTTRLERDRERDLAEAAMEERARIARELHDVIAHAVSVMVVQAGAERRMLDAGQARTADALITIERSGREALGELRRLLGVLRARDRSDKLAPQPGLAELPELVAEARGAGQTVDWHVEGDPVPLPAGLDLTAYRIVQEALTNARKHAPGACTDVRLRWHPTELEIEVVDDGPGRSSQSNGTGHGLIGMRERAALYGGTLMAAPGRGGGFHVRAQLPIERGARS
jgi:signal transduction histidine kinase